MTFQEVRKTLEKQLQLLSERSEKCKNPQELAALTEAMAILAKSLLPSL